ncbi:MAG: hypothetical protein JNL74_24500 [Fibrobacteres bacterium]|nr:hypothetical protein [Fibrobacterota bacterium]
MKRLVAFIIVTATIVAAQSHYEAAASVESKGGHSVNGKSMIDDVSDIYNFPSEVSSAMNAAQGTVVYDPTEPPVNFMNGSAFVAKSITNSISAGFVFVSNSTVINDKTGFATLLGNGTIPGVISVMNTALGGYNFTNVEEPTNASHFLLGLKLASDMHLGLDVFREASNMDYSNTDVQLDNTGQKRTEITERFVNYGAIGLNAGLEMKLSNIELKGVAGFTNLGFEANNNESGTDYDGSKLDNETNIIKAESGIYIPVSGKASLKIANAHKLTLGLDFFYTIASFSGEFTRITGSTTVSTKLKSGDVSTMGMAAGILDEMQVGENTIVYASVVVGKNSTTSTPPDSVTSTTPETYVASILFPKTSVGVEHRIKKLWKFDELIVRAGGFKNYYWSNSTETGSNGSIMEESDFPTSDPFVWTTGIGFVMGKVTLDLTIRPDHWNGVYLISGKGPYAGTVTMTYDY